MPLSLENVLSYAFLSNGLGGPQIQLEAVYLPTISVNRYRLRTGMVRPDVKKWKEDVAWILDMLCRAQGLMFRQPVKVMIQGVYSSGRYPDTNNLHKVICDSVAAGIGLDDKQFVVEDLPPQVVRGCESHLQISVSQI